MSFHLDGRNEFDDNYKSKNKLLAEINMTPFVDVCLVLLIIFMVTAPFALSGVNISVPKTDAKPLSMSQQSLILSITNSGEYYLDKEKILEKNLVAAINFSIQGHEKSSLFIRADEQVPYKNVMIAMSAAQRAGITRIGMIGEHKRALK